VRALDAAGPEGWGSPPGQTDPSVSLLAAQPEVEFRGGLEALTEALRWLEPAQTRPPFAQLLIGHLAYDLGRAFERLPELAARELPSAPEVCLAGHRALYLYDAGTRAGSVVGSDPKAVRSLEEHVRSAAAAPEIRAIPTLPVPRPRTSDVDYRRAVEAIRAWIRAGDVYQVNLSRRLDADGVSAGALPLIYSELVRRAPAPFCAYLDAGDHIVVSNSPERFLRVVDGRVETCPIKGTRPRGRTPEEDRWLAKELLSSAKDRAEHVMIVDLERNDLGRVCQTGSVRVVRLAALRSFPNVHHMVSSVQGVLQHSDDLLGLVRATFPGGSITGAPKIRAMEIIETLEPSRRGVYTGAIGYLDARGELDLSIAIRTGVAAGSRFSLHVGGGIVADSDPEAELEETWHKAAAFGSLWPSPT
jgi:para-aminobenzoate synthetase component 1